MDVLVTGGLGFVGRHLTRALAGAGHGVTVVDLPRSPGRSKGKAAEFAYLGADTTLPGEWQKAVSGAEAVVNLAGANIFRRWNGAYKRKLRDSRVLTTRNVADALAPGAVLVSTSAAGYYGWRKDEILDEDAPAGDDFLARLCVDWEAEALKARARGCRVVVTRFGVVLAPGGGALGIMVPIFKAGMGGPLGNGNQWFSWVHGADLAAGILFALENRDLAGPVNLCSPNPLTNRDFTKALGAVLRRPAVAPAPAFAVRLFLGEFGDALLHGQRMVPKRLLEHGFRFRFPDVRAALKDILV